MTPESNLNSPPSNSTDELSSQSFFSRLLGVYFSPGKTFTAISRRQDFLIPLIVLIVMGGIVGYLMIDRIGVANFFGQELRQAVESGQITQEQADQQLETMTSGRAVVFVKLGFVLSAAFGNVIIALATAAIFRLISMVMGIENNYKSLLSVTLYTFLAIGIVSSLLFVIVLFLKRPEEIDVQNLVGSNLAALLTALFSKESVPKFIITLARWVDVFAIWSIALLAIGYAAVSHKLKSTAAGAVLTGLYAAAALISAAISSMRS